MAFIGLGKLDKSLIPIGIGCVFSFLSRLLFNYQGTILFNHPIITNLFAAFSYILAFIPYIILKIRSKRIKNFDNEIGRLSNVSSKEKNRKQKMVLGKFLFFSLDSFIFFVQGILHIYTVEIRTNFWIFDIFVTLVFYYLIFKVKLYIHHYISIGIIILTGVIIDLVVENLQNDFSKHFLLFILRFVREVLGSLNDVMDKYVMERKHASPYEVCFFNGIICSILLGIFSLINHYHLHLDNFSEYFNNFNKKELLVMLGFMSTQLGLYLFILISNKLNSPCHLCIIVVFGQIAYYIDFSKVGIIIALVLILFMSLIFNEIIELNFCGLSKNTRKNIMVRADSEDVIDDINLIDENIEIGDDMTIELKDKQELQELQELEEQQEPQEQQEQQE